MTDTTEVEKWRPVHGGDAWVRVTDYDALAAKLADAERVARYESDIAQQALDQMRAAEAALPAVYRLAMADAAEECESWEYCYEASQMAQDIRAQPTPTAAELMARIQTGEKE